MPTLHSTHKDFAISTNMLNQSNKLDYEMDSSKFSLWRDFCEIIYPNIKADDKTNIDSTHLDSTHLTQNPQNLKDSQDLKKTQKILQNPQQLAIILSTNMQNFDTFAKSKIFASILQDFAQNISKDFKQDFTQNNDFTPNLAILKSIQKYILSHLSPLRLVALSPYILRLNSANLLSVAYTRALLGLFESYAKKHKSHQNPSKKSLNLKSLQSELHSLIKQLETIGISKAHSQALENILQKNANQSFSIGITGVLSAGKSTFLNALLGREILGTSTIPETANLSILRPIMTDNATSKMEKKDFARVHFWSKQEWAEFETCDNQTSQNHISSNMGEFVRATKEAFGDRLETLLAQGQKEIEISELRDYTSANSPTKYCNLIKKVELFMALPFLQNQHASKDFATNNASSDTHTSNHSVEIVDTPGLDDPIRAREKITREFISHCDLLIHIMNASCAATQVDMDFILESLFRSQVSRLLVVLSRADLLSQKELESSLAYTRNSLAKELTKARFDGDIDALLSRIDFIPLSSYFALGYTSNNAQIIAQASAKGYDKEKTGITKVQDYLDNALLGENSQKQRDILYRAYRGVGAIVCAEMEEVGIRLSLSSASKDELESIVQSTKEKQEHLMRSFEAQKQDFKILSDELESYLLGLEKIITTSLHTHKARLNSLIYDDMLYETSRGNAPTKERINQILGVQVEDISSDLSREYRYKSAQKIASLQANIAGAKMDLLESSEIDSADLATNNNASDLSTNNLSYMGASLKDEVLGEIKSVLVDKTNTLINKYKNASKSTLEGEFRDRLDGVISEGFSLLKEAILQNNASIKSMFLGEFEAILQSNLQIIKSKIANIQSTLNQSLEMIKNTDLENLKEQCKTKDKALKDIYNELEIITKALQ